MPCEQLCVIDFILNIVAHDNFFLTVHLLGSEMTPGPTAVMSSASC